MRKLALVTLFLLGVAIQPASATPFTTLDVSLISGTWNNAVGGGTPTTVTGSGTSAIEWGNPQTLAGKSGYSFTAGGNITGAEAGVPLLFGTFTHKNQTIDLNTAVSAVDLLFGFSTNGVPAAVAATFNFGHTETPNSCIPSPACANDTVTITLPVINIPITVGPATYFFNLLGFSQNGGVSYSNVYSSAEGGSNTTDLYGAITVKPLVDLQDLDPDDPGDPSAVPEPASLVLFGSGLVGLVALRRRARRA